MKWSDEEITLVQMFNEQDMSDLQISKEIDRPISSVCGMRKSLGLVNKTTKNVYKHLYKGTVGEVQERLIKIMQEAPVVGYHVFNSKESNVPSATIYRKYFGSWENALKAAGIDCTSFLKENRPTTLYLIEFEDFYKVGITQQTIQQRFYGYPTYNIVMQHTLPLEEAKIVEKKWLASVKEFQYIPTCFPAEGRGFTECFKF